MGAFDHIAEARAIRDSLEGDVFAEWKERIDRAIAEGSTGTEILMALRWTFAELLDAKIDLSPALRTKIRNYIQLANKGLA